MRQRFGMVKAGQDPNALGFVDRYRSEVASAVVNAEDCNALFINPECDAHAPAKADHTQAHGNVIAA